MQAIKLLYEISNIYSKNTLMFLSMSYINCAGTNSTYAIKKNQYHPAYPVIRVL